MLPETIAPFTVQEFGVNGVFNSKNLVFCKTLNHDFAPMWTHNAPYCPKQEQIYLYSSCHNHLHPFWLHWLTRASCLDPWCTYCYHRISGNYIGLLCYSLWSWVIEIRLDCSKVSMLHLRPIRNVRKCCFYVSEPSLGICPCQRYLVRKFWQP